VLVVQQSHHTLKLVRKKGDIYLVGLVERDGQFENTVYEKLEGDVTSDLGAAFQVSAAVVKKERVFYKWDDTDIFLDKVDGLGEFVELYPNDEESQKQLFEQFGISNDDLITKSYHELLNAN